MNSELPASVTLIRRRQLAALLRVLGVLDLLALVAVVLPFSAMNQAHQLIGLGDMPDTPLMGYLARSASMLYASLGAQVLYMSFDVERYRPLLGVIGRILLVCGVLLLGVDLAERLPVWWVCLEGPAVFGLGALLLWLLSASHAESN